MSLAVRRVFVEKKEPFAVEARNLLADLIVNLKVAGLTGLRILNRYDVAGLSEEEYKTTCAAIFAEPAVDIIHHEALSVDEKDCLFAVEYLPGQYDQRADSAMQCVQLLNQKERPLIRTAKVIILSGSINRTELAKVKNYCINPIESREASLSKPESLAEESFDPAPVERLTGFNDMQEEELHSLWERLGLAMTVADLAYCQRYFRDEAHRDPTITEIRLIDTYWSDHCRHTTFNTALEDVSFETGKLAAPIKEAYDLYQAGRNSVYGNKKRPVTLMDVATIAMKEMKQAGLLNDLDESEEINAASIVVKADINGSPEEWLVMFKNETHNHPTEIEPFGGAATCLGGAIRDPLSGRVYVYQAMRLTGSGDPRTPIEDTLAGKLPQRKITIGAAAGYSSYGNQIGLATGQVAEVYDEGFVAKRMEVGAVIGAAPRINVVRQRPTAGDVVLLVGGRTGRDGCGGATGSSKEHTAESLMLCGAEVQKGNPPTERKIQRLFRNPKASRLIKKCNDFGAGGVSVAIGELADGVAVDLDAIPKKYAGLDGTELAIAESQERMAVIVSADDVTEFCRLADGENVEATPVARVTDTNRLTMTWRGETIVDISRAFLDTNGVKQQAAVTVAAPKEDETYFQGKQTEGNDIRTAWLEILSDLNVCSQQGLVERFDSTIGAGTVLMPFGGAFQLTPAEGMAAKLPVTEGETTTATLMTYGFNPKIGKWSPYHGALFAVVEAVAKVVAMGGDYRNVRLSLQEYFEKLGNDRQKWGKPFAALLGAYYAQKMLAVPAIGGKDSMSGTFQELSVPPTVAAFAVTAVDTKYVVSPEFKSAGSKVIIMTAPRDEYERPDFLQLKKNYHSIHELIRQGRVRAAQTVRHGGIVAAISKMAFGNKLGFVFSDKVTMEDLFAPGYGNIILEVDEAFDLVSELTGAQWRLLGHTCANQVITVNEMDIALEEALLAWQQPLSSVFPAEEAGEEESPVLMYDGRNKVRSKIKIAKPRVLIPVFPGTNCEYDSARAFLQAGAEVDTLIFRNLTAAQVEQSIAELARRISKAQIIMLPGGFSAGDEPDGSGKFIAAAFRNPPVYEATMNLLRSRDGLMLGICNGFQALIKLGLVPYGEIRSMTDASPTLTYNTIGRHVSRYVQTKVVSTLSPWLANTEAGDIHTIAISHGEGRLVAPEAEVSRLLAAGQVAIQYVGANPNGSMTAIEALSSPDGRILGKMGHSERLGKDVAKNVPGDKDQHLFAAGVNYFS